MTEAPPAAEAAVGQEVQYAKVERANIAPTGKRFSCRFMEPGLISYRDSKSGVDLYRKETIDACLQSMVGAALTIGHPPRDIILSGNFKDVAQGVVDKVGYDQESGWYTCEGTVETDAAREAIERDGGISAGYTILERANGGTKGQLRYDQEVTRLNFHHVAIVRNPRVEEADVRLNAKRPMNIIGKIVQKITGADGKASERTVDITAQTAVPIGGKSVTFADMIARKIERENAVHLIGPDDYVEHEGKRYRCMDLIDCWKETADGERKEDRSNGTKSAEELQKEADEKARLERENAAGEEARKKAEAQAKIDERIAQERAAREAEERENARKGGESFRLIHKAHEKGHPANELPEYSIGSSGSLDDGVALGRERYGRPATSSGRN